MGEPSGVLVSATCSPISAKLNTFAGSWRRRKGQRIGKRRRAGRDEGGEEEGETKEKNGKVEKSGDRE